jgi:hypothetical protein
MDGISCSSVCRCVHRRCSFLFTNFSLSVLYFPLQVAVCIWFLYNILGWSAFVGMVVMIALFPIPGVLAGKIQKVQRESTKRVSTCLINVLMSGLTLRLDGCTCAGCYRK